MKLYTHTMAKADLICKLCFRFYCPRKRFATDQPGICGHCVKRLGRSKG